MPPEPKLARAFDLSAMVFSGIESGLHQQYPEASERKIFLRTVTIRFGPELCSTVYGAVLPDQNESRSQTARDPH